MKKLLMLLCALLLTLPALAESPAMAPELAALKTANEAIMDRYGLTLPALGLFDAHVDLCGETAIVTYRGGAVPESLTGAYIVIIAPHGVQPMWTHDGSLVPWQSGDLASPVWGMPQLQTYLNASASERYALFTPYFPQTLDTLDEFEAAGGSYHDVTSANRGAADSARALAERAVTALYSLTEEQSAQLSTYAGDTRMVQYPDGHREWEVTVHLEDGSTAETLFWVVIHAETGLVENIVISSGGVG
ncbi:MAG: hypothetical protein IJE07_12640 [Clostridia bacterium]|nr:hypothetical protein [Clostridia bacterium]